MTCFVFFFRQQRILTHEQLMASCAFLQTRSCALVTHTGARESCDIGDGFSGLL